MKTIIFACLISTAFTDDTVIDYNRVDFPELIKDETRVTGLISEDLSISVQGDNVIQSVNLNTKWTTGGELWEDDTWVQNYAQWESTMQPGKWTAVACTAQWNINDLYTNIVFVQNYLCDSSFHEGDRHELDNGLFGPELIRPEDPRTATLYDNKSYQTCSVNALFY